MIRVLSLLSLAGCLLVATGCNSDEPETTRSENSAPTPVAQHNNSGPAAAPVVYDSPFDGDGVAVAPAGDGSEETEIIVAEEEINDESSGMLGAFGRAFFGGITEGMKETD